LVQADHVLSHFTVISFSDHMDIPRTLQELPDTCADNGMVISQQYPDWCSFCSHTVTFSDFSTVLILDSSV
jgi:hypothetical protein